MGNHWRRHYWSTARGMGAPQISQLLSPFRSNCHRPKQGRQFELMNLLFIVMSLRGVTYRLGQLHQRVLFAASGASNYARLRVQERNGHTTKVAAVIVGRNDDYMPDFAQRLHATVAWNIRHLVNEVIFVEWNPPADRPLLASRLTSEFPAVS